MGLQGPLASPELRSAAIITGHHLYILNRFVPTCLAASGVEVADFDDNDYYNIELGLQWGGTRVDNIGFLPVGEPTYQIRVGREVLEGNGVNALQTPLATVHAFNGWADVC